MEENMILQQETLLSANGYIKKVIEGVGAIVIDLQKGREDIAVEIFYRDLIEGLQWLSDAIKLTKDVQATCKTVIDQNEINGTLKNITQAFENRDYVLIGDLLEYELKPVLQSWDQQMDQLVKDEAFDGLHN